MSDLIEKLKNIEKESKSLLEESKKLYSSFVKCEGEIKNMGSFSECIKRSFSLYKEILKTINEAKNHEYNENHENNKNHDFRLSENNNYENYNYENYNTENNNTENNNHDMNHK
ncbi:hypothetical protein DMUE_2491 [Dictyocoela muelleri]|nr:hypothetical protein DMUE_2491 [Dictyocoela muelleri]